MSIKSNIVGDNFHSILHIKIALPYNVGVFYNKRFVEIHSVHERTGCNLSMKLKQILYIYNLVSCSFKILFDQFHADT